MDPQMVQPGETLTSIARARGLGPAKLAAINHVSPDVKLRPGDILAIPPVRKEPAAPPHRTVSIAKVCATSDTYRHVVKNGYDFAIDGTGRTREIDGTLTGNPDQRRDRRIQAAAGGSDRLKTDHGGHYIARRFNGPTDAFNHFAQDGAFNKSGYAKLENEWARDMRSGQKVKVHIRPLYSGESKRPFVIEIEYDVGPNHKYRSFPNAHGGKR